MKKKINLLLFCIFFSIIANAQKQKVSTTAEVSYLGKSEEGTIYISSCGYNKKDKKTYLQAVRNAFETLIFRGIPGSEVNVPFVENEYEVKEKNKKYFDDLIDGGKYKSFITYISESEPTKEFKSKKVCLQMKINQVALRKDLEQNQVIRKFGF
jgi:ribonucleotide reductase alpha subunit